MTNLVKTFRTYVVEDIMKGENLKNGTGMTL